MGTIYFAVDGTLNIVVISGNPWLTTYKIPCLHGLTADIVLFYIPAEYKIYMYIVYRTTLLFLSNLLAVDYVNQLNFDPTLLISKPFYLQPKLMNATMLEEKIL